MHDVRWNMPRGATFTPIRPRRHRRPRAHINTPGNATFVPLPRPKAPVDAIAPRAPTAPGVGANPPARPAAPAGPKPLVDDATAIADRAALRFRTQQGINSSLQDSAYARQDVGENLRRMALQRPKDEQTTRQSANQQGLFYSGQLGKRLGDLAVDYQTRQGDVQQGFDRGEAARVAARNALQQGMSIEDAAITAQNADRAVQRDSAAADVGGLVPTQFPAGPQSRGDARAQIVQSVGRGAVRAQGIGNGQWKVRFSSGALRTLRQRNGRWEILRSGGWKPF